MKQSREEKCDFRTSKYEESTREYKGSSSEVRWKYMGVQQKYVKYGSKEVALSTLGNNPNVAHYEIISIFNSDRKLRLSFTLFFYTKQSEDIIKD
jgi:hypothetical protein